MPLPRQCSKKEKALRSRWRNKSRELSVSKNRVSMSRGPPAPLILILPLILIPHPAQPEPPRTSAALGGLFFNRRGRRETQRTQRCPAGVCTVFESAPPIAPACSPQQSELRPDSIAS